MDKKELKEELNRSQKIVEGFRKQDSDALRYGKQIAKRMIERYRAVPFEAHGKKYHDKGGLQTDHVSNVLSEILYQCYSEDRKCGCQELLMEWIMDKFWGKIVMEYIPTFREVWQYLHDNKFNKRSNALSYGDADASIWVEYPKQLNAWEDKRKVVIHKSHCSCSKNNTHIFIYDEDGLPVCRGKFNVRTVWNREVNRGNHWGDDRDIEVPSLSTYRKRNFEYSYGDGRDKGYALRLDDTSTPRVEWSMLYQKEIEHALYLISAMKRAKEENESI